MPGWRRWGWALGESVSVWLMLASGQALAAEQEFFADLPIVLSASRLAQPLADAPGAMTVIDQELIRASGARQLSDVMRLVPGMQVTAASQEAGRVTYHGLTEEFPSRLQILVDGRSQYSPLYQGGVNWSMIPVALEDIDRIEVLRGPNSAAYGANAFLGVINIITLPAAQAKGVSVSTQSGSGGIRDTYVRWGGSTPGADFRLTARESRDTGLDKVFDDQRNLVVDMRGEFHLSDRDELLVNFGDTRNVAGFGQVNKPCNPAHDMNSRNTTLAVGWRRALAADSEVKVDYAFTSEAADDTHLEVCGADRYNVNYGGHARRHDLEVQHLFSPGAGMRLVWGVGLHSETVHMPFYYYGDVQQSRQSERLFANLEWQLAPRWLLNAGATLERDTLAGGMVAPRLMLNHHLNEQNTLRIGASRAFRPPTLFETRADWRWIPIGGGSTDYAFVARPGLQAERVDSQEIGYLGEFRPYRLSLDVRLFKEVIPNRILAVPRQLEAPWCTAANPAACPLADYAANGEHVAIRGLEYQLRWQPAEATRLLLNQSFVQIRANPLTFDVWDYAVNTAKVEAHTQASAPSHSTTAMWMQQLPFDMNFSLTHQFVGAVKWTRNSMAPSYHRTDWRLAKSFRIGSTAMEVAYTGRSTTDSHAEFRANTLVTPRGFVSLRMDF